VNSLGRGWRACAHVLRSYHRGVRAVRRRAHGDGAAAAQAALDELLFALEVDLGARASAAGRSRMTEVEHSVLVPALEGVRASLVRVPPAAPPSDWDAPLDAALVELRRAVPGLRPWCRGGRRR
jgi:hypothetical protein